MFQSLTKNLTKVFDRLRSGGILTESQINDAMRDIRIALLEADVALPVVKEFIESVKIKALGAEVIKSISPAQMVVKIINDELENILTAPTANSDLNLKQEPPANILMIGLQGSGKTTASAKLALHLKNQGKKVLVVSLDVYRPAAQEQLRILADSIKAHSLDIIHGERPIEITKRAIKEAKIQSFDVVIYDSAGRLHIDDAMIIELQEIRNLINPIETLLVIDSMMGQDALQVATHFDQKITVTGVILSRIDGDTKGGAALSVKRVINKPIKFLSSGEKLSTLEKFDAKRIAARILDMGDILSLVEKAAGAIDAEEARKTAERVKKGRFDLNDYLSQITSIKKMGGISAMASMIPGVSKIMDQANGPAMDEKIITHQEAIILSMTKKERKNPDILNATRRRRIAAGSGRTVQEVNRLIGQYKKVSDMMKKMSSMNPKSLLRSGLGKLFS
jgi:signal recognition particle subunit SRP54